MKYIKIILVVIFAIALPFAILRASIEYNVLWWSVDIILYLFPIYLPILFAWFGIKIFKATNKIFFPIFLFDILLVFLMFFLTEILFAAIERSLADAVIGLLLMGPLIYSVPISFIAAAIYKHKKKKAEAQKNNEYDTTDETQI